MTIDPVAPTAERAVLHQLLLRCARQDQAAFAEYYRLTSPPLNALLARLGSPPATVESVLVTTYVLIWRQADDFARDHTRSAWAWTLALLDRAISESADQPV